MSHGNAELRARRADFPALAQWVHGKPLIYLDNASTSQKPQVVLIEQPIASAAAMFIAGNLTGLKVRPRRRSLKRSVKKCRCSSVRRRAAR